ncbi:MAG: hypothetical protein RQ743_12605 [Bacteroidales bacterium]|nr:hypothetical protein [Bacteroidales bacterium]
MRWHRRLVLPLVFISILLGSSFCEKYGNGPEIEWLIGSSLTYTYSHGVISGFTANIKFHVIDGTSGEIKMTAEYDGQGKSCTGYVVPNQEYKAVVVCGIGSTPKNSAVIIDCPTVAEPYKITTDVKTGVASIKIVEI